MKDRPHLRPGPYATGGSVLVGAVILLGCGLGGGSHHTLQRWLTPGPAIPPCSAAARARAVGEVLHEPFSNTHVLELRLYHRLVLREVGDNPLRRLLSMPHKGVCRIGPVQGTSPNQHLELEGVMVRTAVVDLWVPPGPTVLTEALKIWIRPGE